MTRRMPAARSPRPREEWRPVPGYERFYDVSCYGRVRSMLNGRERIMKGTVGFSGYLEVKLSKNSVKKCLKVHRLVCAAFCGPCPVEGMDCAHLDGSRTNNVAWNLAWATRAENMSHKRLHGTAQTGERGPGSKLKQEQVEAIRSRAALGEPRPALAKAFGVSLSQIRRIVLAEAWR